MTTTERERRERVAALDREISAVAVRGFRELGITNSEAHDLFLETANMLTVYAVRAACGDGDAPYEFKRM